MKILIIEDERPLADSLKALLEQRGFDVECVYDGLSGAEYAELALSNMSLDLGSCTLVCGERSVRLSAKEFDVMRFLLQAQDSISPKETILSKVWGYDSNAVENHVEVYVGFLRKKLASIGSNIRIETVRRLGYRLEADGDCFQTGQKRPPYVSP